MLRQFEYCPVIPWIIAHYNIAEPPTYSMEEGKEIDLGEIAGKICGDEDCEYLVEEPIIDEDGLLGFIDILVHDKHGYKAVEVKKYKNKRYSHQIAQLKAYAELYSSNTDRIVHEIILVQENEVVYRKRYEYHDKIEARRLIEKLDKIINSDRPPLVEKTQKCNSCWYRRICPIYLAEQ